jgi:hypothetical protein
VEGWGKPCPPPAHGPADGSIGAFRACKRGPVAQFPILALMTYAPASVDTDFEEIDLDRFSADLAISKQTLVRWADRGIIDATLHWGISDDNRETRLIRIAPASLEFLRGFAVDYREDTVSRTEARRILKLVDRSQVQKLLRHGQLEARKVEEEMRVVVGSIEDHLLAQEAD